MAIERATHTNSTVRYDYAIGGVPFFSASDDDMPYLRDTADWLRDALDITAGRGEESLAGWWYRSQRSFHLGAGLVYFDPITSDERAVAFQFADSHGVDVWTPGQVTLLHSTTEVDEVNTDETTPRLATYQIGGRSEEDIPFEDGVLFSHVNNLVKIKRDGTPETIDFGGDSGSDIYDIMVSGGRYYVAAVDGLYSGSLYDWETDDEPGTRIYEDEYDGNSLSVMAWIKDRFILGRRNNLYELPIDTDPADEPLPDPLFEHPLAGWNWTGFAAGPDCIFASGWRGDMSRVYATTLETTEAGATPTLSQPYVVVDMPWGERVYSMATYMGTYLILGTSLGLRVCIVGSQGEVSLGPLSCETDRPVRALFCSGKFCWFAGSYHDSENGIYRLDLSAPTDDLRFPWARDIVEAEQEGSRDITGIAEIGQTMRMAMASAGGAVTFEDASNYVASGYVKTGKIRYDTWEPKRYQLLDVATLPGQGTIGVKWANEAGTEASLGTVTLGSSTVMTTLDGSDGAEHHWIAYKFTLNRYSSTVSPKFAGYQVKANPSGVKPRAIRIPLMCSFTEASSYGRRVNRSTWDRIQQLEAFESSGEIVVFQDFGTGEQRLVVVDRVQFVRTSVPESNQEREQPTGRLIVTLRTVD